MKNNEERVRILKIYREWKLRFSKFVAIKLFFEKILQDCVRKAQVKRRGNFEMNRFTRGMQNIFPPKKSRNRNLTTNLDS